MPNDFYVYVYFRLSGEPCYIGKGRGRRWRNHLKRSCNPYLKNIIKSSGGDLPHLKIRSGLSEKEAFEIEIALIRAIGRRPNGPLVNLTDGGDGSSGYIHDAEARAKLSASSSRPDRVAALIERNNSPENIARLRLLAQCPERRAAASTYASSAEHIARLSAHNKSPEKRARVSITSKSPKILATLLKNTNSPEWKARRSAMSRTPEHQAKLLEHNHSAEHRAQVAERNRSDQMRQGASKRAKERNKSPEFQARAAEGLRRYYAARAKL